MSLTAYNFYAGMSGLQPIDSIFWLGFSLIITTWQMGWTFLLDQDAPMVHAANVEQKNKTLDTFRLKQKVNKPEPLEMNNIRLQSLDIYDEETNNLRYNIADYYKFSKINYQLPLAKRTFFWELYAIASGCIMFFIPFMVYGYGVADSSGKTESLYTIAFASYQAVVLVHHFNMFVTIRNFSTFYAVTCTIAILITWPCAIVAANYEFITSENMQRHLGHTILDQFFLQASSVVLCTFIICAPIYIWKAFKMRVYYPQFFPLRQSTN